MGTFLDALRTEGTKTARTGNNAITHSTTTNAVLDFFALAGAKRNDQNGARTLFRAAFAQDPQLAVRALFYLRDIRGGQGERELFRFLFKDLIRLDSHVAEKVAKWIPEYGRWDDLVSLADFNGFHEPYSLIDQQLADDLLAADRGDSVSLLAKWLPSENASSTNSKVAARKIATILGMSNKEYRQIVVSLRKQIKLLEQQMSANEWKEIEYGKLPSQAGRKHTKAFKRHDAERYDAFLNQVLSGEKKLNAKTVYTYEVMDVVRGGNDKAADAFWKSLPDYTNGGNALVVADTSGSMGWISMPGAPIVVSTSLALYFAERNKGPFKDYFITFSESPQLVAVRGKTLTEKLQNISMANWGMNTDIQKVFNLILRTAQQVDANAEDIPKTIYIISDMEFDHSTRNADLTAFENAREMFSQAGYELPHVVFWNVNSRNNNVPATAGHSGVTLVSGLSQSTFRYVMEGKSPVDLMLEVLNGERYAQIEI